MTSLSSSRSSSTVDGASSPRKTKALDLSALPAIYVLPTHLPPEQLHRIEDQLEELGAPLTYDITEAKLVIGKVGAKRRAELELRTRKLWTEEIPLEIPLVDSVRPRKRKRSESPDVAARRAHEFEDGSTTEDEGESQLSRRTRQLTVSATDLGEFEVKFPLDNSETEDETVPKEQTAVPIQSPQPPKFSVADIDFSNTVRVLKLQWLEDSLSAGEILPIDSYLIYHGQSIARPPDVSTPTLSAATIPPSPQKSALQSRQKHADRPQIQSILERAKADAAATGASQQVRYAPAPHGIRRFRDPGRDSPNLHRSAPPQQQRAQLLASTTSDYDGSDSDIPAPPEWVRKHVLFACQRATLANPPNEAFIDELKKIKLARLLTGDEIGVRSYSTLIASIAAYEYPISHPRELLRLPGCDVKAANLWIEWKNSGEIAAAEEAESDEALKILKEFYDIWGVGATTAREFFHDKGWRDIDDVIEFGWPTLSRVQQIGVKYYEEFQRGIPRSEVQLIAQKVEEHAVKVRDSGIEALVVGGYRRGKEESGDVDIIVSHRDLDKTLNLVNDIVASLEVEGWITHTLLLSLTTSHRGQSTLPFKSAGVASHGAGFDTLDKALVVWQDPNWPTKEADLAANPNAKNPNLHRRVDIIISPWRTVGCAVLGWSGGTTFQRDIRRYVRKQKGWKFDSSGVRDRYSGQVVQLEGENGVDGSMVDAEKAVFEGMGLVYREPWERCTG